MRLIASVVVGLGCATFASAAPVGNRAEAEYDLGTGVGRCVAAKCQIFRGFLLTDAPKSGEPVTVRVDRVLFGPPIKLENVQMPYEDFDHAHNGDGGGVLAAAWMKVKMFRNAPVTVVLGLERGFAVLPGEPVFATSDESEAEVIRSLAEEASRLEGSPDLIAADVASLSSSPNPALAGYLFGNLFLSKAMQREASFNLVSQLVGSPSVPAERWEEIVGWLKAGLPDLPTEVRSRVAQRLVELGQQSNVETATAAYAGLVKMASWDDSVTTRVSPAALEGLRGAYRAMVSKGRIPKNPQLEAVLGMKLE